MDLFILQGALSIKEEIQLSLTQKKGLLVGRFGTVECEVAFKQGASSKVLERNAGVFPCSEKSHSEWCKRYMESIAEADILALGWYVPTAEKEKALLEEKGWKGKKVPLRSLEPYYVPPTARWSQNLAGQKVCVVSSFAESAAGQVKKGAEQIWGQVQEESESLWPRGIEWSFVKTGYAPVLAQGRATWSEAAEDSIENWQVAVSYVVQEVLKTNAQIVLIGCGGLGMIIGKELKASGKICLVLGGATQVFLGIRGKRWEKHDFISKLWRDSWVWPTEAETPAGAESIEGGCYWG